MKTLNTHSTFAGLSPPEVESLSRANKEIVDNQNQLNLYTELLKIKYNKKQKDVALRPLFFNVGMVISLLFVIIAINWKSYDVNGLVDLGSVQADLNEIIEIPISKQPPPPPVKQEVFKIAEVKDTEIVEELEITLDVEVTENEALEEITITEPIEEEVIEEVFVIVEKEPMPEGGFEAFYTYLAKELKYPASAIRMGISGSVYIQFIIEKDGRITQASVVKGIGAGCDEEAIRVVQNGPPWTPGKQRGVPVRVKKIIPVKFVIKN
jgi:protein TonB